MSEKKGNGSDSTGSLSKPPTRSEIGEVESTSVSCVSMKSDRSMFEPLFFGAENLKRQLTGEPSSCAASESVMKDLDQLGLGRCLDRQTSHSPVRHHHQGGKKPRRTDDGSGKKHLFSAKKNLKEEMQRKFALVSEGNVDQASALNSIYTNLYITTGGEQEPDVGHELTHAKRKLNKQLSFETIVKLSDILKPSPDTRVRTALTKGVAGIGKSFAVHKFILDWAEERTNQELEFIFCLAFRELNLSGGETSLHLLLTEFHPVLSDLKDPLSYVQSEMLVVLDGLDESRLQLDFNSSKVVRSVEAVAPMGDLLVNLIQGNLLPHAHLWITSRPAASAQIPAKFIDAVTEIRGFSDAQKEEYFRRRFRHDSCLAERIISQVQSSPSLSIMCQIPVFCWISTVLFEEVFTGADRDTIPQTLTEMMAHFLLAQTKRRSRKYDAHAEENNQRLLERHREFLLKLGKLAFVHLQENKLIFYEGDLEECGLDVKEVSVYSGFYNAVLRKEDLFSQRKVFFFVHLTIQEFFAALFVYECLMEQNTPELCSFLGLKDPHCGLSVLDLLKKIVAKVMEKKNEHLDFFLRFLLGLMVEQNRRVLQGLLTSPDPNQDTDKKTLTYLKSIRRKTVSPDGCISLFQAMVEMRDHKVKDEIQEYLTLTDRSNTDLPPLHCSALAYMLQVSKDHLEVLDMKSYNTSDEGRRRLIPAVKISRKAILADCRVTTEWIQHLVCALAFPYSRLRDLDLSNNDLKDSDVKQLCEGLSLQCCRLHTLRLSGCLVTENGCEHLALALRSNPSHLMELDLSYNHLGATGEKMLVELWNDPQYRRRELNVEHGGRHRMKPGFKKSHKNLLLSEENRRVSWVPEQQPRPPHAHRFDECQQVLSQQGLDGRCYFELDALEPFSFGLTYRTIGRKGGGGDCQLGHNYQSWAFTCSHEGCFALHGEGKVGVASHCSRSSRVGVYLDRAAGTLSFYRVSSDSHARLHTFTSAFTEPLYLAVELHTHSNVLICR
ncbi:NACHT, LRR and PYD domains-containing protein 12-like isoform X2 [Betta splendens]|uniref:NACHT, LRR and PYD domains-containing protein 12-like isoform X2 n=1 Tax=Betta splendens TaxID=158456 RepID=A0A9W2Y693_BETSP|nr:NACHT, LRR and PYD domains-containing protein 12-like isoform X2 [Betta splendens]